MRAWVLLWAVLSGWGGCQVGECTGGASCVPKGGDCTGSNVCCGLGSCVNGKCDGLTGLGEGCACTDSSVCGDNRVCTRGVCRRCAPVDCRVEGDCCQSNNECCSGRGWGQPGAQLGLCDQPASSTACCTSSSTGCHSCGPGTQDVDCPCQRDAQCGAGHACTGGFCN